MILEKKPNTVEAFQFLGGPESVVNALAWAYVRDRRLDLTWTPEILNDGEVVITESLNVRFGTQQFGVPVGQWLVIDDANHSYYPASGEYLFESYRVREDKNGDDSRPV